MKANLTAVSDALAGLTDFELHALIVATREVPQDAPALLAWVKGACDWEINRRVGRDHDLRPPEATINLSQDAVSIEAMHTMRESFASGDLAPAVLKFFDALAVLLTGGAR